MAEPGGGDHLEEVVPQGELGQTGQSGQGCCAEGQYAVMGQVQASQ